MVMLISWVIVTCALGVAVMAYNHHAGITAWIAGVTLPSMGWAIAWTILLVIDIFGILAGFTVVDEDATLSVRTFGITTRQLKPGLRWVHPLAERVIDTTGETIQSKANRAINAAIDQLTSQLEEANLNTKPDLH